MFLKPLPPKVQEDCKVILDRKPGERFQYYYHRHREKHLIGFILTITGGLVCVAVALFFAFMPGPAIPFWFLGAMLISSQLLIVARFLDKIELVTVRALQDKRKRRIIRRVLVPCVFISSGIGTYVLLFKFLPKVLVIVCAVVAAAFAAFVPYMVLKEKQ